VDHRRVRAVVAYLRGHRLTHGPESGQVGVRAVDIGKVTSDMPTAEPRERERPSRASVAFLALGALLVGVIWLHVVGLDEEDAYSDWVFNAALVAAALSCLAYAVARPPHRLVAGVLGLGLLLHASGGVIMILAFPDTEWPVPSVGDPLWLSIYPCAYVALAVMTRQRVGRTMLATRLDGLLSGLAVSSVVVCVTLPAASDEGAGFWTNATNLAYPIADMLLLGAVVSAIALSGWRINRRWLALGAATVAWVGADVIYLIAPESWELLADAIVLTGTLGMAAAVTLLPDSPVRRTDDDARGLFIPVAFTMLPLAVLVLETPLGLSSVGVRLAGAALAVALIRMAITLRANQRMLAANRSEIDARDRAQEALQATLAERDELDEQMRTLLAQQRAAEGLARGRAQTLLDDTTSLVSGPLSEVAAQVHTVQSTATSIERQVADADGVTARVVDQAREMDRVVLKLAESLHRVGGVASVIGGLANQTNLLALNATIESARAGEAGRSFSVVAGEVKQLSRDTARFTEEITSIIDSLRADAAEVTAAINTMTDGIGGIGTATSMIRAEVWQQRGALDQLNWQAEQAIAQARQIGTGSEHAVTD
jgi:hypothetical protein